MRRVLSHFTDLFLGSSCVGCDEPGELWCATCDQEFAPAAVRSVPDPCPAGLPPTWSAGAYDGALRAAIVGHKERGWAALARPLGELLAAVLTEALGQGGADEPLVLIPVPSRRASTRARGRDPVLAIVRAAAAELRHTHRPRVCPLLTVNGSVRDQAGLNTQARAANVFETMSVRGQARGRLARHHARARLWLCDDVITTGATLVEAQRALRVSGLPVAGAVTVAATQRYAPKAG